MYVKHREVNCKASMMWAKTGATWMNAGVAWASAGVRGANAEVTCKPLPKPVRWPNE